MSKTPGNAHWSAAVMAYVIDRAEESVGQREPVAVLIFADEEENEVKRAHMT